MNPRCQAVIRKIERADKHIHDLDAAISEFLRTQVESVRFEDNQSTGERSYYLVNIPDIPSDIPLILGDALQNLRSSLDHLAWQLVEAGGGTPGKWTAFPIAGDAAKYIPAFVNGKIGGARQDAIKAINAIKPYKGGDDDLWRLHELNNVDKHRLLLTACLTMPSRSIMPRERTELEALFRACHPGQPVPDLSGGLLGVPNPVPLKTGDPLLTIPQAELEEKVTFVVHVSFNEPQVIKPEPVILVIKRLAKRVRDIVTSFDPMLISS